MPMGAALIAPTDRAQRRQLSRWPDRSGRADDCAHLVAHRVDNHSERALHRYWRGFEGLARAQDMTALCIVCFDRDGRETATSGWERAVHVQRNPVSLFSRPRARSQPVDPRGSSLHLGQKMQARPCSRTSLHPEKSASPNCCWSSSVASLYFGRSASPNAVIGFAGIGDRLGLGRLIGFARNSHVGPGSAAPRDHGRPEKAATAPRRSEWPAWTRSSGARSLGRSRPRCGSGA